MIKISMLKKHWKFPDMSGQAVYSPTGRGRLWPSKILLADLRIFNKLR
jgi:hypothetical protein